MVNRTMATHDSFNSTSSPNSVTLEAADATVEVEGVTAMMTDSYVNSATLSSHGVTVATTANALHGVTKTMANDNSFNQSAYYGPYSDEYFQRLSEEQLRNYVYQHQLPGQPSFQAAVSIICLACLVFICSSLILLATRYTSGGQSATLVFLRSLLLSDILMSMYGIAKMSLLLCLRDIKVNFFLPDSLFFTASLASTASLLSLNLDCFLKLTRPLKYAQVDKHTIITVMLFVWNAAFVIGFLPLVGWYQEPYTFRFFSFFPWHFLLFNGLVVLLCAVVCVGCMVTLRRVQPAVPDPDPACFRTRSLEVRKYRHLHRTILMESCMWLAAYLPFFVYISLTCRQCPAGDFEYSDASILYFVPVFLVKSLVSAGLQAFRTVHVHAIMNKLITDISHMASPPRNRKQLQLVNRIRNARVKDNGVATISYTNPLCLDSIDERRVDEDRYSRFHGDDKSFDTSGDVVDDDDEGYRHFYDNSGRYRSSVHYHPNHRPRDHHQQQHKQGTLMPHHHSKTLLLDSEGWLQQQQALQDLELTDMTSVSDNSNNFSRHGSVSSIRGITNLAYRQTLIFDEERSTKL